VGRIVFCSVELDWNWQGSTLSISLNCNVT
jgi:hypothetical protein